MKKYFSLLLTILPLLANAQSTIPGTVTDTAGHPLDGITITLSQQNKYVATAIADLGHFTLKAVPNGQYTLSSMSMGYQPTSKEITIPCDTLRIIMTANQQQLQGVTVAATKPVIERKTDRIVFNVENSIIASGGTSWDALSKAPGVTVNSDNSISAYRKGVEVYMDGKPLHLSGDDLVNYLQGLPSSMITRIEVLTNPPASFEAQGGSVINIITKKVKKEGVNVSLNGNYIQGVYSSYNGSSTFNYRKNNLNIYGNYGYAHKNTYMKNNTGIDFGNSIWDSKDYNNLNSNSHTYRLGADYQLTDNQVIGVLVSGNNRAGHSNGHIPTSITSTEKSTLDSTILTDSYGKSGGSGYTYNVNYSLKLDSGKRSLNIDLDYAPYETSNNSHVNSTTYLPDGSIGANPYRMYTPTKQHIDIYSGKADYAYPLGKIWSGTSGFKYSSIESDNNFLFYEDEVLSAEKSNHFKYTENTTALYSNITGTIGKLTMQAGVRAEFTRTRGYSITLDSLNKRQYFKLFPSVFLQYKVNEDNELSLTYSYRVDRPEYARMNPARHYASPYNYYVGNPSLQPAFVHNAEIGYTYKQDYNITATFTSINNIFSNITVQDNTTHNYYVTHANLGLSLYAGLRISAAVHPASFWDMNLQAGGYFSQEKSDYLTSSYNIKAFSYDARLTQTFTLNKKNGIAAELITAYNSPGIQNIYKFLGNGEVDFGIKSNVLKGKGTIRLTANDIFNTLNYRIKINYLDQKSTFFHQYESRNFTLSFSYRLGKDIKAARSRSTASEEEKRRAQ